MARSKGISYGGLIIRNLYTMNASTSSQTTKILKNTNVFRIHPTTTMARQRRAFCELSGNQEPLPPPPPPPSPPSSSWKTWTTGAVGIVVTMVIPLLQFKEEVDMVMEKAEQIIDVVEVVAEAVDMVAEKIADDLPEGNKLKTTLELIEETAETVAGKAQKAVDFIDQVQETEQKLMPIIEPVKDGTQVAP